MFASLRSRSAQLGPWPRRLAALACLVLAVGTFTTHRVAPHATAAHTQIVVVATRVLPVGHRLAARDLTRRRWPTPLVPDGASTRPVALIGKVLASPVTRGEPMFPGRVVGHDLTAGLSADQVAAEVAVDGSNTAALINAGDRVDVLGSPQPVDSSVSSSTPDPAEHEAVGRGTAKHGVADASPVLMTTDARVLAVLTSPGDFGDTVDVVIATDRSSAMRLVRASSSQMFTLLPRAP